MIKSKKDLIYETVIELLKKDGIYAKFTISQIAQKADIGKGTVYEYFNSKEQLYAECIIRYVHDSINQTFDYNKVNQLDFESALKLLISQFMNYFSNNTTFFQLFLINTMSKSENTMSDKVQAYISEEMYHINEQGINQFIELIQKGQQENKIHTSPSPFEIESVQLLLVTSVVQYYSKLQHNLQTDNADDFINHLYHILLKLLN